MENKPSCNNIKTEETRGRDDNSLKGLPVVIIGAGPIGLAASAKLADENVPFVLLEAGSKAASNIHKWQHVRLFTPWENNIDSVAKKLLLRKGWESPTSTDLPTGADLITHYLEPLADLPEIKSFTYYNAKVVAVTRKNRDKMKSTNRAQVPFVLYINEGEKVTRMEAGAVLDATGTWSNPNPINSEGVWLKDEQLLQDDITYGIPNLQADTADFKGKHVAVVGSGHSALNTLADLAEIKETDATTSITWILRKDVQLAFGLQEQDDIKARGNLGVKIRKLIEAEIINVVTPFYIQQTYKKGSNVVIQGNYHGVEEEIIVDKIIANTGNRADFEFLKELRLDIDPITESNSKIASLIDPNKHSCGSVPAHGEQALRHTEQDFYIVGMKSYGRAPTFLLKTGYEQVNLIVAHLAGNDEDSNCMKPVLSGACGNNE